MIRRRKWLRHVGPVERAWVISTSTATLVALLFEIVTWH